MSEYINNLAEAISKMHDCRATHLRSQEVIELHDEQEVWRGDVELFQLEGHPKANIAYGWAWKDGDEEIRYIGILHVPPVESAVDAVRAAIASGQFN